MGKRRGGSRSRSQSEIHPIDADQSVISVNNNLRDNRDRGRSSDPAVWKLLDIEPLLVIHLVASMISYVGNQNLLVVKACLVDLGLDESTCMSLKEKTKEEEQDIQKLMSSLVMWKTMIGNFLPMILVAQIGAWSDKHGRKLPMLMVIGSFIIEYTFLACAAHYRKEIGAWKTGLIASGIASMAGNNACFGMAVFSYISDVTPRDKLTSRTSISGSCYFLGILVGLTIGGYLSESPLPLVYSIAAILEAIVMIGLIILVKSTTRSTDSIWIKIKDLLSPQYITESVKSVFKRRPKNGRKILLLLLTCHVITLAPLCGDASVEFLSARYRYKWDAAAYSSFTMYKTVVGFVANFLSMALLSEYLQLSDPAVGIVSCLSLVASFLIAAIASTARLAYVAPLASLLSGSVMAVSRTIMFKVVSENETGKINSFIGSLESLTPLIVVPLYTNLYAKMFEKCAGCYHILSAVLMIFPISVYVWIRNYVDRKVANS